jgi:hypothetical protein
MAQNFMAVAGAFGPKTDIIADLAIQPTAAYLLAAPSVPDEAGKPPSNGPRIVKDDKLHGMIFFHGGDDSEFVAKKKGGKKTKR